MAGKSESLRINEGSQESNGFGEGVMNEIGSLREELTAIRQLMEREHSLAKAIQEYNYLPSNLENPIRWGFMGVWGKGGSNSAHSVMTNTEDAFFNDPQSSDENVAAFAAAFTKPGTIKVCKYLFRSRQAGCSREDIKNGCNLTDEELDAAVKPLLEWYFARWVDGKLETSGAGVNGQGINYVITIIGMAKVAVDNKENNGSSPKYP